MVPILGRSRNKIWQSLCLVLLGGIVARPVLPAVPIKVAPPATACAPEAGSVCLGEGRFLVEANGFRGLRAEDAGARTLGPDAAYFRFSNGAGLVVQVVDGRAVNGHFWVLSGAFGQPSYRLEVTDLATGQHRGYSDLDGADGGRDLVALPAAQGEQAPLQSGVTAPGCAAGASGVCLHAGRLGVEARTHDSADVVMGQALSERTAIFRRSGGRDPELVVSVLDGREVDGQRWVLSTSRTGQEWDIVLTDLGNGERLRVRHAGAATAVQLRATPVGEAGVAVTLDTARAVKKTIAVAGGSIQAQSANGTKFTLTLPANALLSPQEITLTPIKSIGGLPFKGGLAGGVEIAPAGLRLAATASLRIAPSQPVPLAQETTFAYRARGAQFFLYPALPLGKAVVLPVLRAGGYGLARGTAAEQAQQLKRLPPRAEDQLSQKLWKVSAQRRRLLGSVAGAASVSGAEAAEAPDITLPVFQDFYRNTLNRLLPAIQGSCAGRKSSGPQAEHFLAMASAMGVTGLAAESAEVRIALDLGTAACYNEAGKACLVGKDSKFVIPMLVYWRQLVLAGMTDLVDSGKLESCLTFEFEFDTLLDHDAHNPPPSWNNGAHHRIDTKAPVRWRAPFQFGEGPATPHNYIEATWTAARQQGIAPIICNFSETGTRRPSTLTVYEMTFLGVNSFEEAPPLPKIELAYSPGKPEMEIVETCPPGAPAKYFLELFPWAFFQLHPLELDLELPFLPPIFVYRVKDWSVRQGALFALKGPYLGRVSTGGPTASEVTTLYIFHKPGG